MGRYRFKKMSENPEIQDIQRQIEDNFAAVDKNGDLRIDGDIYGKDGYLDAESLYLGSVKISAPNVAEEGFVLKATPSSLSTAGAIKNVAGARTTWIDPSVRFTVKSKAGTVSASLAYTALYNEMILGGDYLSVTLPTITSKDIGKEIGITNNGTLANITVTPTSATIYGQATGSVGIGDTWVLMAMTTSTWRLV